ncbi:hypothetical protein [Vitiosangium sp. GDMCC 1.1324]|uniref:hypothetical protein n=1 Tax=Vitiosangium sp. (strain GDMCC 1.1324) TaxID=2138576 RepID=UPI000D3BFF94|nr:hypothetical protein [Vitiosangium sp. GDMCC 1.1324]PTL85353.1 hypothetical protein DAT35_01115 [Vitiosangium sp. GDMCC 1.1324]
MSTQPQISPAAAGGCPISAEILPPNMRKHVDPAAPAPLRMMAAKALVPLAPADMLGALFMLTFDPDAGVRETAAKTAAALPDRFSAGLRDENVAAPVLGWFLTLLRSRDALAEMLVLNPTTPDEAVAEAARDCSAKISEIIGQNQLRVLRHENIIRNLCTNPNASPALLDNVCDFAVRSGLVLADVPQMQAARVRLFGPQAVAAPPDPGPTAEEVLKEFQEDVAKEKEEEAAPMPEGKKLNLTQRVMKMSIAEKIKLATLGNKEARSLLIRDTNKLVCTAVIRSPRITDGEVLNCASNKAVNEEVLRIIYNSREFTKNYKIKIALLKNPKLPLSVGMKFLNTLRENDVKELSRDKNVPSALQGVAKKMMEKKNEPKKDEK